MATERSSLLRGESSSKLLFDLTHQDISDNGVHWFELSQTNVAPDQAPMWKARIIKPETLGMSESLWVLLSEDLNEVYGTRRRKLWIGGIVALSLAFPICNLLFANQYWTIAIPAVLLGIFLRHELQFTSDAYIPLSDDIDDSFYYAPFQRICAKYQEELASHGVRATVMADEEGSSPQRAYLIFAPTLESGSEGLYFV